MKRGRNYILGMLSVVAMIMVGGALFSVADEYHGRREENMDGDGKHHDKNVHGNSLNAQPATNATYEKSCGGCHWAYVPALLPSKSWENILETLNDHFGNDVVLSAQERSDVYSFLTSNSSEKTSAKIGRKISQSLGGVSPSRIVDVPYIQRKHRKVVQATFLRNSIKSLSNCIACHPSASVSRFDDDDVKIPSE